MVENQQGLTWRNDPLLFDPKAQPSDSWLTANELIEVKQGERIFLKDGRLNIYPILIRRIDFVRTTLSDRILSRFPYAILSAEEKEVIREHELLIAAFLQQYFYRSINDSLKTWRQRLKRYLQRESVPYPVLRCVAAVSSEQICLGRADIIALFESAKKERFTIPLKLSEDLAYLTGVIDGDGHLEKKGLAVVDSSQEHIANLRRLFQRQFGAYEHRYQKRLIGKHGHTLLINGKWIVRFFNFISGHKIGGKKYASLREPLLFRGKPLLRRCYWNGLMDADGSYKYRVSLSCSAEQLKEDFCLFLDEYEISYAEYESWDAGTKAYSIVIPAAFRKRFAALVSPRHPQKERDLKRLLEGTIATRASIGKWSNQVIAVREEKLLPGEFFDFSCLEELSVMHAGKFIKKLRLAAQLRQADILSLIDQSLLSKYELDKMPVPIRDLKKILSLFEIDLSRFLQNHSLEYFTSKRSSARLDLQPNPKLLEMLRGLQLKDGYFLLIGLPKVPKEKYRKLVADYFKIEIPKTQSTSNQFYNAVLEKYIKEFMILS